MTEWEKLENECKACTKCDLCKTRQHVVFGAGNPDADILFVGEAPGQTEDETGEPFTGRSGKLFDDMLLIIGMKRSDIFISNILKCRPPQNRDPRPEEQDLCIDWLRRQTALIKPKLLVCLGRIAAKRLIDPNYKITVQHGEIAEKNGMLFTAMYHPSALLRDPHKRPETYDDLKKIQAATARFSR